MQQGRKTGESEPLQGQTGNHRFVVSVKKCLHSHCFTCVARYGKKIVLLYFTYKLVIDKARKREYFWVFILYHVFIEMKKCVLLSL